MVLGFWQSVIFTEESKFIIFGHDGLSKVWKKTGTTLELKNLRPTVKFGGELGKLVFIDEIMHRWKYLDILKNNLKDSVRKLYFAEKWVFQQDNKPKHTALIVRE